MWSGEREWALTRDDTKVAINWHSWVQALLHVHLFQTANIRDRTTRHSCVHYKSVYGIYCFVLAVIRLDGRVVSQLSEPPFLSVPYVYRYSLAALLLLASGLLFGLFIYCFVNQCYEILRDLLHDRKRFYSGYCWQSGHKRRNAHCETSWALRVAGTACQLTQEETVFPVPQFLGS